MFILKPLQYGDLTMDTDMTGIILDTYNRKRRKSLEESRGMWISSPVCAIDRRILAIVDERT